AAIEAEEDRAVHPLEIEQKRKRLAHTDVRENLPPRVEHEVQARLRQPRGEGLLDDAIVAEGGEVVAGRPAAWIVLFADIEQAFLECLVIRIGVAVIVET